jgi:sulfane dehydrogenase subunit SoxC
MPERTRAGIRRRSLLERAGLALAAFGAPAAARAEDGLPPWTTAQGGLVAGYGTPSAFEKSVIRRIRDKQPLPTIISTMTPLQDLTGIVTPNGLHHARCHAGVPTIDPDQHRLLVHGLVDRPLSFGMDDLVRFPSVSRLHFIECSGNSKLYKRSEIKPDWTAQDTHGQVSCAEWTGVRLADVLEQCGVQPEARWLLAEGADAAAMGRSVPLAKALDDAILAYAQNGERLRPENGYPLRLLLPGYEGNMNVKWLRRVKLGAEPFQTRDETAKYTDLLPDGKALQFNFIMAVKSVITSPSPGRNLRQPGYCEIRGLAWSGRGRVARVEVATDGENWQEAVLQEPVLPKCLTRFRLNWRWDGAPAMLRSRATDESGDVQPTRDALLAERGENFTYHYNAITAWRVAPGGALSLAV